MVFSAVPDIAFDEHSKVPIRIDFGHHEIHEGDSYFYSELVTIGAANRDLLLTTPNTTKRIHFTFDVVSNAEVTVFFYENPTINVAGVAVTELNRDRNSANTADMTVEHTPTVGAVGTALMTFQLGTATGASKGGGGSRLRPELILKQNEEYLLRITGIGANTDINTFLDWYEHTP